MISLMFIRAFNGETRLSRHLLLFSDFQQLLQVLCHLDSIIADPVQSNPISASSPTPFLPIATHLSTAMTAISCNITTNFSQSSLSV